MIDWIKCLEVLQPKFDNEGSGGTADYQDEVYGEISFQWHSNKSKIQITWFDSEPFCICGFGIGSVECDCEWDWFQDTTPKEKIFTKKQVTNYLKPSLF